jgi:hypothetical protein
MTQHTRHDHPSSLTEGNIPANEPTSRDEAVIDDEFTGLDNDLIDMGEFSAGPAGDASGTVDEKRSDPYEDHDIPGAQERPLTEDEKLEKSLEDTFPTSDPIQPSHIDGPNN